MAVTFDLPPSLERRLAAASRDVSAEAKEAYRRGELTRPQLAKVLGLSRFEVEGVTDDLVTVEDLAAQFESRDPGVRKSSRCACKGLLKATIVVSTVGTCFLLAGCEKEDREATPEYFGRGRDYRSRKPRRFAYNPGVNGGSAAIAKRERA